jgi:UDP-2-acetamido-3-amino-2,3-dideoxy-glucuronate N-acetyltransferase
MWLVGAGYWGSKLLETLKKFDVTAQVIDIRNGQTIDDITTKDPVMLATPLWQHHEQTVELLKRGHDVYVEKPMAETVAEIADIQQHLQPGQLLMVGHLFVHHPQMHEIRSLIDQGVIGTLQHVTSRRLNWGIYQTKTDPLLSLAVHDISILLQVCSQPTVTHAQAWNYAQGPQHDRVLFSGYAYPVTFDVDVSWHWPVRTRQTVFIGTQGQIVWDQDVNSVTVKKNLIINNRAMADENPVETYLSGITPLEAELKHWIDCIRTRQTPSSDIQQAAQVAKIVQQVKDLL